MKILFLTPQVPYPPRQGAALRNWGLISGLAARHGVTVLNAPGTIDADYRGEVQVILVNLGDSEFTVARGMRIAQMVVAPIADIAWREAGALPPSGRGAGGLGSTGNQGIG
jgi:dUTP pyrophosphatase